MRISRDRKASLLSGIYITSNISLRPPPALRIANQSASQPAIASQPYIRTRTSHNMTRYSPVQDPQLQSPDHASLKDMAMSPQDHAHGLHDYAQTNDNDSRDLLSTPSITTNNSSRDDDSASPPPPPVPPKTSGSSVNSPALHVQPPSHPPLRSQSTSQLLPTTHLLHEQSTLPERHLTEKSSKGSLRARSSLSVRKQDQLSDKGKNRGPPSTSASASASASTSTSVSDGTITEEEVKDTAQVVHQSSARDRGRAIARLILPGLHHTFSTRTPSSKSTPASGASTPPPPPLQSQSQSQTQPQSPQNPSSAGGIAPPPASLPVTLTPGSDTPAHSKPDASRVPDMFGANFVHPSTVEYLTGGYAPGGVPGYVAQTPLSIQNHIHSTAFKRITTLSYLQDA